MQQFTVPQFIDVEDKIIGPVTTRQFLIMMSAFILIAICYKLLDFAAFAATGLFIFAIFGIVAFLKINGRPFHFFLLNLVQTLKKPRIRIWNYLAGGIPLEESDIMPSPKTSAKELLPFEHRYMSRSRLAELSLVVDTRGVYQGEKSQGGMEIKSEPKGMDIL
jgi:hypothetical protein